METGHSSTPPDSQKHSGGGNGALVLEREVRKTYYRMPTELEVKNLVHFIKFLNSAMRTFTLRYGNLQIQTVTRCNRQGHTAQTAKLSIIKGENEKTERRLNGEELKLLFK